MRRLLLISVFAVLCGCPGPTNPPASRCEGVRCTGTQTCNPDTGACEGGAAVDAGTDAGVRDAGTDAGVDAGLPDAGIDAGIPDAGLDAGFDAGVDAGTIDAGCTSDTECSGGQHCDPDSRDCVECFLDAHCPSSVVPVCDVRTKTCVGCVASPDCANPTPVCDAQQCLPCNTSAECGQGRECSQSTGECTPLNDTCATARTILPSGSGTASFTTEPWQGIDDTTGSCNGAGPELVYAFTTTTLQSLTITAAPTAGSSARPVLYLRSACTTGQLACDAPTSGSASLAVASLAQGSYFLFVESANGAPGRVAVTVSLQPPQALSPNDTCSGIQSLSANGSSVTRSVAVGNTTVATNESATDPTCSLTARAGPDLLYSYTLTARANVNVVARPLSGSALHPVVSIRSACATPSSEVVCQAASSASAVQASVLGQQPGSYVISVDSADGTTGAFQLELDATPTVDNDACTAPQALTFNGATATTTGDTTFATNGTVTGDVTPSCSDSARGTGRDLVYSYTLTQPQDVTVSVTPTGSSPTLFPVVSVRSSCTDGTRNAERGCVSPFSSSAARVTLVNQPAGTYFVWVDSAQDTSGPFQLEVVTAAPTPPPANDSCSAPQALVFSNDVAMVSGSTTQAANDNYAGDVSPTCSPSAKQTGRDVVYQFTLAQPRDVTFRLAAASGSTLVPALYVRRSNCSSQLLSEEVLCLTDLGSVQTTQTALAAGTYFVFVDGSGGSAGAFDLTLTQAAPTSAPGNDDCGGATALNFVNDVATVTGSTFGASNSNTPSDNAPACGTDFLPRRFGRDLVYTYTLSGSRDVDITVTPAAGSTQVPTIYVRAPTFCSSFSAGFELTCVAETEVRPLRAYLPNQAAGTYSLFVDTNGYGTGDFSLTVQRKPATVPPANDSCTSPATITLGATGVMGDTTGATNHYASTSYSAACRGRIFDGRDVVYQFTAPSTGTVTATLSPEAGFDAALLLLQPSCSAAQCVRFSDGGGAGVPEAFSFAVTAGQTYFLVVDNANRENPHAWGRFGLTVQ